MSYWLNFFSLRDKQQNKQKVLEDVTDGVSFRGANSWILACAILVASVGLNVNSTAVIIGAMLISPLMGPIVGAGFGLGTYNFVLLRRSLKNLLIATIISLLVSFLYFYISPYKEIQSELLARTSPNIYDVLIAFFGGIAGAIAITRVERGNPIPGVAIATALMPPLCTAGFGLAIGEWRFFLGAIYLYTINCVFICIATFFIVKYLNYPIFESIDKKEEKRFRFIISMIIVLMLLPSAYFAYQLRQKQQFKSRVEKFIRKEFENQGRTIIYQKTTYESNPKKIELAFLSRKYTTAEVDTLNFRLSAYGLQDTKVIIRQDSSETFRQKKHNETNTDNLINELRRKIEIDTYNTGILLEEIKILFPSIINISIANHYNNISIENTTDNYVIVVLYESKSEIIGVEKLKLKKWLSQKFKDKPVEVYRRVN